MEDMSLFNNLTRAGKLTLVNDGLGNTDIRNQQGTSRVIYDSLPADATTFTLQFFQSVQNRTFPFTNLNENKLQDGEALVVERIHFSITPTTAGAITDVSTFEDAGVPELYAGQFSIFIDTKQVIKDICLTAMDPKFSKNGWFDNNNVMILDTNIVIPPNKQWRVELRLPTYAAITGGFIRCTIEGQGTLWNSGQQM
jgi:hypothetical protein